MWRILWGILCIVAFFMAPWWVVFVLCLGGIALFPWYLEAVILGAFFDAMFGGVALHWYGHLTHTFVFSAPLLVGEFIKRRINL